MSLVITEELYQSGLANYQYFFAKNCTLTLKNIWLHQSNFWGSLVYGNKGCGVFKPGVQIKKYNFKNSSFR
jgi:hypothetical protein